MTDARTPPSVSDIATAGEYVLGTLPADERTEFARRLLREPALQAEVARWQASLDPLGAEVAPIAPPAAVWRAVEARLFGSAAPAGAGGGPGALWRWMALGAAGAAALMIALFLLVPLGPTAPAPGGAPQLYVSDMVSEDGAVRLAALYDAQSGEMRVSVGGQSPSAGRDFELWLIEGDDAPISLGVMPQQGQAAMPIPDELRARMARATLAITDEPLGGSPQGIATGPVVAAAPLRQI